MWKSYNEIKLYNHFFFRCAVPVFTSLTIAMSPSSLERVGIVRCVDLVPRGHYDVHGDAVEMQSPDSSARSMAGSGSASVRFAFQRPSATADFASQATLSVPRAGITRPFQR